MTSSLKVCICQLYYQGKTALTSGTLVVSPLKQQDCFGSPVTWLNFSADSQNFGWNKGQSESLFPTAETQLWFCQLLFFSSIIFLYSYSLSWEFFFFFFWLLLFSAAAAVTSKLTQFKHLQAPTTNDNSTITLVSQCPILQENWLLNHRHLWT